MIFVDGQPQTVMAWIPARGGSKGLPRKALLDLQGLPVIAHTIKAALDAKYVDRVLVNTDDEEIRQVSIAHGAEVPFLRPAKMAEDDSPLEEALQFQYDWLKREEGAIPGIMIGMSPTHPFRCHGRLDSALEKAASDANIMNVRGVAPCISCLENYWIPTTGKKVAPFWDGEIQKDCTTVFQNLFSYNIVLECRIHLDTHPIFGRPVASHLTQLETIDLDDPHDMALARLIAAKKNLLDTACFAPQPDIPSDSLVPIYGKLFQKNDNTQQAQVLVHKDYPLIDEEDVSAFTEATQGSSNVVISGCDVDEDIHPFRLLKQDEHGYLRYLVDLPNEIRGKRQHYPTIRRFVPALVYLPPGTSLDDLARHSPDMWLLPKEKLLDVTNELEQLCIEITRTAM
ncbi:cytidylyltransferase domain-containing protein [Desulfovibrio inopinatus]|uniref:acylneuraminate cytidylyltransferase family protein n=1 Tax=Desulfovibrio inopinatus TaxID=102109 RepID=UPI000403909F|nr:NTP transferase domain-containing protein [Desulfovibrio inopinatus]